MGCGHKILKCVCGLVLLQCRCPTTDKPVEVREPCQCFEPSSRLEMVVDSIRKVTDRTYPPENTCVCGTTAHTEPAESGTRYWCDLCPDGWEGKKPDG